MTGSPPADRFWRGPEHPGGAARVDGPRTGLGLAIVRQIAEAHGGSVRVASSPASGATFTVEIPLCRASLS